MDIRKVKKLIELLEESDINEIEIKEGEESVRISRSSSLQPAYAPMPMGYPPQHFAPQAPMPAAVPAAEPVESTPDFSGRAPLHSSKWVSKSTQAMRSVSLKR